MGHNNIAICTVMPFKLLFFCNYQSKDYSIQHLTVKLWNERHYKHSFLISISDWSILVNIISFTMQEWEEIYLTKKSLYMTVKESTFFCMDEQLHVSWYHIRNVNKARLFGRYINWYLINYFTKMMSFMKVSLITIIQHWLIEAHYYFSNVFVKSHLNKIN